MTTFYQQQAANRRKSLLLAIVVVALLAALGMAIGFAMTGEPVGALAVTIGAVVLGTVLSIGSYFSGDKLVLAASGAKPIDETQAPQLINIVRELSLAAGLPMPKVYVIDDSAPNAFATGRDPEHASIAVTTGLLQKLDREELQGVIGHELAHVRNFDIRFTLMVGVLVGSIALLADMYLRWSFWFGGGRRGVKGGGRDAAGFAAIMAVLAIVLAIVAPIIARLVQMAVSRQREYLADASAVELTRNPYGLERALAVIASDREVLEVANRATQHLYFTNPIKKFEKRASGLFSTHPAIVDRVNRLRDLTGRPALGQEEIAVLAGLD